MQIGSHQGIQGRRAVDHTRSGSVYQFFVPLDIWKFFADLHGDFIPHHHGMALGVRLGHYRQQFTRTRLRQLKRITHDALYACARHHRHIGCHFNRMALVRASTDTCVFTL